MVIERSTLTYPARRKAFAMGVLPTSVAARMRGTSWAARTRVPFETQPFDEQVRAGAFHRGHPVLDDSPCRHVLAPAGWDGPVVRRRVGTQGSRQNEVEFLTPGDRAHGQVVQFHGRGTLSVKAPARSGVRRVPHRGRAQARRSRGSWT
jgi:hypothetical protein